MIYQNVGDIATDALAAQKRAEDMMEAENKASLVGATIVHDGPVVQKTLEQKKKEFIKRLVAKGHQRASETAEQAIDDFLDATHLSYQEQVNEAAILKFYRSLRDRGNGDRTVYNKHVSLFGFLKWLGLDVKKLAERPPSYTEKEVEIYEPEDLKILFDACNQYQRVIFELLLKTGLRMQEAMNLEWVNVDFRRKIIKVREQLDTDTGTNVRIKDRAERSVPLPDDLAATLKAWKDERSKSRLVIGTASDTPNDKLLLMLKRIVKRAGLNCGHCSGCRGTEQCSRWKIKTFRSTYLSMCLRAGVDPRTLMEWSGHEDLATLLKYLAASRDPNLQQKVSSIKWA
jgi:integrase